MPRKARQISSSNIYHVMVRGVNRQQIFLGSQDYEKFLYILKDYQKECNFTVFAYCLMGNHFHLLLRFEGEPIGQVMRKINTKYASWFNAKYGRVGHLFQGRYKSEPVEDEQYFLNCVRYIHQNPAKANIADIDQYAYSSYSAYLSWNKSDFVDTSLLYSSMNRKQFLKFHEEIEDEVVMDIENIERIRLTEEQARKIVYDVAKCNNADEFQSLDKTHRKIYLREIKALGVGVVQLSRLTGESEYKIRQA